MNHTENRPGVGTGAIESSAENVPPILPDFEPNSPGFDPFTFKPLPAMRGNDVDPIHEARLLGFSEAWDVQQVELTRVNEIADLWYLRANNSPAQIKEIQQRQIDKNYAAYERRFMAGGAA